MLTGAVPVRPETCAACGFDGADYDLRDALNTLRSIPTMWAQSVEGTGDHLLHARPSRDAASVAELTSHSADLVDAADRLLRDVLTHDAPERHSLEPGGAPGTDRGYRASHDGLASAIERLLTRALATGEADDPAWTRRATVGGQPVDAAWVLRHAVHAATHDLMDVGRALHQLGAGAPMQVGTVARISTSDGGVPKRPVESAPVERLGVVGDRQTARQHHGRPFQALCLWSAEVIDALRAEGHPIEPGFAGENLTLAGIDWSTIRPGVRLRIGDVLADVSAWSAPCKKNAAWFVDGDFRRMGHDRHPGWSRAYAWVRQPGTVTTGDEVVVEP